MKLLVVLIAAASLALGHGLMESPIPGRFEAVLEGRAHVSPMTVTFNDTTGIVRDVTAGGSGRGAVSLAPGRTDAIVVDWTSGRCDDYTLLTLRRAEDGYDLTAAVRSTALHGGDGCAFLDGIGRSITVVFGTPIDPDLIQFARNP